MHRYVASPRSPPHLRHPSARASHRHHPYRTGGRPLRRHDSTWIDIPGAFPITPNASAASIDDAPPTDTSRIAAFTSQSYPRASATDGLASGQHTITPPSASQPGSDRHRMPSAMPTEFVEADHIYRASEDHVLQYELSKARMRVADLEQSLQSLGLQLRNANAEKAAQAENHRSSSDRLSANAAALQRDLLDARIRADEWKQQALDLLGIKRTLKSEAIEHRQRVKTLEQDLAKVRIQLTAALAEAAKARAENSGVFRAAVESAYAAYDGNWQRLKEGSVPQSSFILSSFPWPVFHYNGPESVTQKAVTDFLFNTTRVSTAKEAKRLLRLEMKKFHADKFDAGALLSIVPDHRVDAVEVAKIVTRHLLELKRVLQA